MMPNSTLLLLTICCVLGFLLTVILLVLLVRIQSRSTGTLTATFQTLLADMLVENQRLRNLLLASDVPTLAGLNQQTLPREQVMEKTSDPNVEVSDLIEAINYEELMGEKGYESGDLADELDAAGWPRIPIKRTNDGDPIAFDAS